MKTKYTAGPWLYGYGGGNSLDPEHSTVWTDGSVQAPLAYLVNYGEKQNKANARLIAASPDLVEALEFLVRASERLCVELENRGCQPNMARDALRQAKRTIKNATGQKL